MLSEYCGQCGHKLYFEGVKPKFCSKCGEPFNSFSAKTTSTSTAKVSKPIKKRQFEEDDEVEDDFDIESLDPRKLGIEKVETFFAQPVKIGDVAGTRDDGVMHRPRFNIPEGKSVLALTEEECRSSKNNPIEIE